jgi:hypothetical protein
MSRALAVLVLAGQVLPAGAARAGIRYRTGCVRGGAVSVRIWRSFGVNVCAAGRTAQGKFIAGCRADTACGETVRAESILFPALVESPVIVP